VKKWVHNNLAFLLWYMNRNLFLARIVHLDERLRTLFLSGSRNLRASIAADTKVKSDLSHLCGLLARETSPSGTTGLVLRLMRIASRKVVVF
jgi:hypothetical protein